MRLKARLAKLEREIAPRKEELRIVVGFNFNGNNKSLFARFHGPDLKFRIARDESEIEEGYLYRIDASWALGREVAVGEDLQAILREN